MEVFAHDPDGLGRDRFLRLVGRRADVVGAEDALVESEGIVDRSLPDSRLFRKDVESHAELLLADRAPQRVRVDEVGARRVDEHSAFPHPGEEFAPEEALRFRRGREMQGDDVAPFREVENRIDSFHPELLRPFGGQRPAPRERAQAERAGAPRDFAADRAHPGDADRPPEEAPGFRELLLVPFAGMEVADVVGNPPVEREDEPHRELGDGDRVLAGAVRDEDPAQRRGLEVDRVDARPGPHDEGESSGRLEDRSRHFRRSNDQHVGGRLAETRAERVVLQVGLVQHLGTGIAQPREAGGFELVGDEDFHGLILAELEWIA